MVTPQNSVMVNIHNITLIVIWGAGFESGLGHNIQIIIRVKNFQLVFFLAFHFVLLDMRLQYGYYQ